MTDQDRPKQDLIEELELLRSVIAARENYRGFFENAVEGFFQSTPEGHFIHVNPAFACMFGYGSPEEMISGIPDIAVHYYADPEDRRRFRRLMAEKGSVERFEFRARRKDGSRIWVSNSSRAVSDPDGRVVHYEGIVEDITGRREMEERLRESEVLFKAFANAHTDLLFMKDEQSRYLMANDAMLSFFGKSRAEVYNRTDFELMDSAAAEGCRQSDQQVLERRAMIVSEEQAGDRFFETRKFPFRLKDGKIGIGGLIRDVTEQKRAEEERRVLEERLQRSEKMEALGMMAGGVAHDLNNVLGILVGYAELLLEKLPEGSPLGKYAGHILQSSLRGTAIIQDLLDLARRGVKVSEVVDLNRVVRDCLKTAGGENLKSRRSEVSVTAELDEELLRIKGSPAHLGKAIMNLVSGAAESIQDTGEVVIRTENRYLDRPVQGYEEITSGDYVILSVSDNGSGIAAVDIEKIFEPFYTKKVMGRNGTGLEMSVVWGMVKDHNGYIDVVSGKGKGRVFTLYFPATREELSDVLKPASRGSYMGHGETVLVVDDVREQRELAVTLLERLGYRVAAVAGGEEAVSCLKTREADLVVLDMIMDPGIDGLETYRRILEVRPGQKAIIVSGYSETERVTEALRLGAGAYVRKPYILERIGQAVRKELDRNGR